MILFFVSSPRYLSISNHVFSYRLRKQSWIRRNLVSLVLMSKIIQGRGVFYRNEGELIFRQLFSIDIVRSLEGTDCPDQTLLICENSSNHCNFNDLAIIIKRACIVHWLIVLTIYVTRICTKILIIDNYFFLFFIFRKNLLHSFDVILKT